MHGPQQYQREWEQEHEGMPPLVTARKAPYRPWDAGTLTCTFYLHASEVCNLLLLQTTGCRWTGLTVSKQQLEEAVERVKAAGLSASITLLFCDYRECPGLGPFDKVLAQHRCQSPVFCKLP